MAALTAVELRPYQKDLKYQVQCKISEIKRSAHPERNAICVQSPTGSGKTVTGADFFAGVQRKGNDGLFILPRRELVYQGVKTLTSFGILNGVIMAGEQMNLQHPIQVASFDTLLARAVRRELMELPPADVVVADEAHLTIADEKKSLLLEYKRRGALILGLTATPARGDGRPLREVYDHLILGWTPGQMMDEGYLVRPRYFAPSEPDLAGIRKNKDGDYSETELGHRMDQPKLVGDIVSNWLRIAPNESTVVFCVTRSHSRHVCAEFVRHGIKAEHVDGDTPDDERAAIFDRVRRGVTQVLCNVFVASYGLDIPVLQCTVLARPTLNITLYLQMIGRVLRPVYIPGMPLDTIEQRFAANLKLHATIIDHAGAIDLHGFADDPVPWTLDGDEDVRVVKRRLQEEFHEPKQIKCFACGVVFKGSRYCPGCGRAMIPPGKPIPTFAAELKEIGRDAEGKRANKQDGWDRKIEFYAEALGYCQTKGFKPGFAANQYKEKYGMWPNDKRVRDALPKEPTALFKGWIKHRAMKRARTT